jgi:alpha-glucosidase
MHDTLRFWLDRGIDGFRADVVHNIGKNPALADHDGKIAAIPHCALNDDPITHGLLREIRVLLDAYPGDRAMVGEVFLLYTEQVAEYYGTGDELHLCFNFPPLFAPWQADAWRGHIEKAASLLDPRGAWPTWVLSNHDQKRHRTRYGSEARARVAAMLLLTLRGTPFMYMGEELGLEDAIVPPERVVDPADRDGCRAPIPWLKEAGHGWPEPSWLPLPPDAGALSHEAQREDPDSMLHLYKRLLSARKSSAALQTGTIELLEEDPRLLVHRRVDDASGDDRLVLLNLSGDDVECATGMGRRIEVATSRSTEGEAYGGTLPGDTGLILA